MGLFFKGKAIMKENSIIDKMIKRIANDLGSIRNEAIERGGLNKDTWSFADDFCGRIEENLTDAMVDLNCIEDQKDILINKFQKQIDSFRSELTSAQRTACYMYAKRFACGDEDRMEEMAEKFAKFRGWSCFEDDKNSSKVDVADKVDKLDEELGMALRALDQIATCDPKDKYSAFAMQTIAMLALRRPIIGDSSSSKKHKKKDRKCAKSKDTSS
jgi:hypothetical protein